MKKFIFICTVVFALIMTANAAEGDYIIKYRDDAPRFYGVEESGQDLGGGMFLVSKEKAHALNKAGMLEICATDDVMTYYDTPANDTHYSSQYNIPMIKAPYAWRLNTFGDDVLVAVIDSGLAANHPDIDYTRVVEGYNFGAISSDSDYQTNRFDTTDISGHGTMVAGVIAAKRNNSVGISGIADKVKLLPIKVENKQGSIYTGSVISAINAAAGYGCDVINISLGQGTPNDGLKEAVKNAINSGCIVVCAVGNDTKDDPGDHFRYPAAYPGVIGVASIDSNYSHAESSVTNKSVFISAPAHGIPVLHYQGGYVFASGTSFASPQVAAAAAIAKSIDPNINQERFSTLLRLSAYRPTAQPGDAPVRDIEVGYGTLNIERMMRYMFSGRKTYVSPIENNRSVVVFNLTEDDITLTSILASYSSGKMVQYDSKPITIAGNGYYVHTLTPNQRYNVLRHYLWNSIEKISPYDSRYIPRQIP